MYNNGLTLVAPSSLDIQCGYYPDEASIVNLLTAMRKSAGSAEARWLYAMHFAEVNYTGLLNCGKSAQDARSVLPNSLKTEIVVTMNLRSWRHFFKLRALGKTGKPHPDMLCIAVMLLNEFADRYPVFFGDIANELPEGLRQPRRNCNTCSHHNTDYCGWCEGKSLWAFN
jgi:thymidylate synthase ThyX